MITYIIQVLLFQIAFLAVYDFFLSKETFYKHNRIYLLTTPILSFSIPLIKISTLQEVVPQEMIVMLPEIMLSPQKIVQETVMFSEGSMNYTSILFWSGVVVFALIFTLKLLKIFQLIVKNESIQKRFYKLIYLQKQSKAFSFFHFIFLGKDIPKQQQEDIIKHEIVHAKQKHSLDLLFFELLRIVMWFNPMVYFYQHRITLLHEYISDAEVLKSTEKKAYFNKLLSQTFEVENISFVNQFYKQSFIKKRITMMTKNKSNRMKKVKYLLLLPLLASMLVYTSCEKNQGDNFFPKKSVTFTMDEIVINVNSSIESLSKQTDQQLKNYLINSFSYLSNKELKIINGSYRIYTVFSINDKGEVIDVKVKAPNSTLKDYTYDVIKNIPESSLLLADGKPLKVKYTLPITLNVNNTETTQNDVPYAIIEEVPVFPGCSGTRRQKVDCLNQKIRSFTVKNFNKELTKTLNLSKGRKKIWVTFRIDKNGNIGDVEAKAPHVKLKEEAIRIAKLLPKMEPGRQRGEAVGVKYTLPISFVVE
ncbi:MAG: energy transducer TonB [Flavobacteriaceae bacterium]|nr:energy transducer TonB [Flavobacteriaceae bacterium]